MKYNVTKTLKLSTNLRTKFSRDRRHKWTEREKEIIRHNCGNVCNICKRLPRFTQFDYDHVIPLMHGGKDHISNMQILCKQCHKEKTRRENEGHIDIPDVINRYNLGYYLYILNNDYLQKLEFGIRYDIDINDIYIDVFTLIFENNYQYIINDINTLFYEQQIDYIIVENNYNYPAMKFKDFLQYICCKERKCMDNRKHFKLYEEYVD